METLVFIVMLKVSCKNNDSQSQSFSLLPLRYELWDIVYMHNFHLKWISEQFTLLNSKILI